MSQVTHLGTIYTLGRKWVGALEATKLSLSRNEGTLVTVSFVHAVAEARLEDRGSLDSEAHTLLGPNMAILSENRKI